MNFALAALCIATTLIVGQYQVEAYPSLKSDKRAVLLELMREILEVGETCPFPIFKVYIAHCASRHVEGQDERCTHCEEKSDSGADENGIFQTCDCDPSVSSECLCHGFIGTGMNASMHAMFHADTDYVDFLVKCNGDNFIEMSEKLPSTSDETVQICSMTKPCGDADVRFCFTLYQTSDTDPPHGCNDVTVTINGGEEKTYTQCMPGTK